MVLAQIGPFVFDLGVELYCLSIIGLTDAQACPLHSIMQRIIVVRVERIQVTPKSPAEQHWFLRYDRNPSSKLIQSKGRDVHTVYLDASR
jgi:hypothetical protein